MIPVALMVTLMMAAQASSPAPPAKPNKQERVLTMQDPAFLAKRLVGVWEQPPGKDETMGVTLTLASDGTATISSGIMEDLNYNFDGKQLIVVDANDPDDVKQTSTVVLNGDNMKETNSESGQSAEFVRVGAGEPNTVKGIVGEWKRDVKGLASDSGLSESEKAKRLHIAQNGRYYYRPDGQLYVRIPVSQQVGRWSLAVDGTLRLEFGGKAQESKVALDEEELTLTREGGKEVYHKAEW